LAADANPHYTARIDMVTPYGKVVNEKWSFNGIRMLNFMAIR